MATLRAVHRAPARALAPAGAAALRLRLAAAGASRAPRAAHVAPRARGVRATAVAAEALQVPHGPAGELVDLMAPEAEVAELVASCGATIECSDRNACDVELLAVGGFSPLKGFLNEADYDSVVADLRLVDGTPFGLPIVMDTRDESIEPGMRVLLTYQGQNIAVMDVDSKWTPNKALEAKKCYGTSSLEHPGVQMIAMERGPIYIGGAITGLELPKRVFPCATPAEIRASLPEGKDVVAFQVGVRSGPAARPAPAARAGD